MSATDETKTEDVKAETKTEVTKTEVKTETKAKAADTETQIDAQSWVSSWLGLDRHPDLKLAATHVVQTVAHQEAPQVAQALLGFIASLAGRIPNLHPIDMTLITDAAALGLGKVLSAQGIQVESPATPQIIADLAACVVGRNPKLAPIISIGEALAAKP